MDDGAAGYLALGSIAGAILIDWFALAKKDAPMTDAPAFAPGITPVQGGATFGLSGMF